MQRLVFGEYGRGSSARAEALLEACERAGIDAELSSDIRKAIWEEFVFLVGLSAATTTVRLPIGPIRADPQARGLLLDIMRGESLSAAHRESLSAPDLPRTVLPSLTASQRR